MSAPVSVLSLCMCFASSLASCLSSMWVYQRTPTSPSAFPFSLFHALLQGTGRGKTKRLNILDCTLPEEKQWFDVPCVCQTKLFCLFGPPFFFYLHYTELNRCTEILWLGNVKVGKSSSVVKLPHLLGVSEYVC